LDVVGEDIDFLSKVSAFHSVGTNHLFLLQLHVLNVLLVLLLLAGPFVQSQLRLGKVLLQITDEGSVVLLLILKSFSMLLFPLAGVETRDTNKLVGWDDQMGK
jgi:hypothetical protein